MYNKVGSSVGSVWLDFEENCAFEMFRIDNIDFIENIDMHLNVFLYDVSRRIEICAAFWTTSNNSVTSTSKMVD